MNEKFSEATRSTAFMLSLSKNQIEMLQVIDRGGLKPGDYMHGEVALTRPWAVKTLLSLHSRGLAAPSTSAGWITTQAGALVVALLVQAGFGEGPTA